MKKLYVVNLVDTDDGGNLIAQAMFDNAKDARREFIRVRKSIFEGYDYDEFIHNEHHFTLYRTNDYMLEIEVVKINEPIEHYLIDNNPHEKHYRPMNSSEDFVPTIGYIFDSAVKETRYGKGFKSIYDNVAACLLDSFVSCEYYNKKGKQRMKYYVHSEENRDLVIVVCKNVKNSIETEYSWHYE